MSGQATPAEPPVKISQPTSISPVVVHRNAEWIPSRTGFFSFEEVVADLVEG